MATYTTNYNLKKPAGADLYDIGDFNDNFDKIDAAIYAAAGYFSRQNLLDNWYFPSAVNQRGRTSWAASYAGYMVDRWRKFEDAGSIQYDAGRMKLVHDSTDSGAVSMRQYIDEKTYFLLKGRKFTVSVICENVSGSVSLFSSRIGTAIDTLTLQNGINTIRFNGHTYDTFSSSPHIGIQVTSASDAVDIVAIKMEVGENQTMARTINDSIVLNDVPNYGEQLLRCKRFYQIVHGGFFPGRVYNAGTASAPEYKFFTCIPLEVDMDESISEVQVSMVDTRGAWYATDKSGSTITGVAKPAVAAFGNPNSPTNGSYYVSCSGAIQSAQDDLIGVATGLGVILSTEP